MTTTIDTTATTTKSVALTKYATETIGTMLLVTTIGTAVGNASPLAPLGIGAVLAALVYAGGHVSGAHYNPAVTIAAFVRGRIGRRDAVGYVVAQLLGGLLGAALVRVVAAPTAAPLAPSGHQAIAAFVAELVFTFALCYVVLNVATSKDHPDNSFYGLAIGFTVMAGAIAVGGVSGAVFNPAVLIGGTTLGMFSTATLWFYLVAQVGAGLAAGYAFRKLSPGDDL
jgi:aquaporin Z